MEELHKIHSRCILLYIAIPVCAIGLAIICAKILHILLPFQLIWTALCLTPLMCALLRLKLWKKRDTVFSAEELESRPVRIFFSAIPAEICFSLIALGFLLSGT